MMTPQSHPIQTFQTLRRWEGAALAAVAVLLFAQTSGNWGLFFALLLLPDLGMLGYLAGPRVGARTYNACHTYLVPVALGLVGYLVAAPLLTAVCAIWVAHIGLDRAIGYGLKHDTGFKDTHLSRWQ